MSEAAEGINSCLLRIKFHTSRTEIICPVCIAKRRYVWHCISLPTDTGSIRDPARFDRAWLTW